MDEATNAERDEKGAEGSPVGGLLDTFLKNPELISKISGLLSGLSSPEDASGQDAPAAEVEDTGQDPLSAQKTDELSKKLSSLLENKELMSMLPGILSALKPPGSPDSLPAGIGGHHLHHSPHKKAGEDKKIALMCALKPYMSGRRREMIDYLIRINKLGDIFHTLT